ncbi:MAG: class I SAM-dependent methyltransferase [Pseudanabaenaceae cyanobacterium SKYGB_i_bin29]|nr:class I SAM-dependent methyltransferase [Pseudanabaenaceae cyanobacterium SKYG29]MDW8420266.1 class I SAM-dependent methyltransferase [Pseudanabaenaceae cyanobacterium SKYGB_i_bin29]
MSDVIEQVKRHFDEGPYPDVPLDKKGCNDLNDLYRWSLITPFYRKYQKLVSTEGMKVLDVGCGSGYVALRLVEANPGISLTGVDLSPKSVEVAQARFAHHGYKEHKFIVMSAEDLAQLGESFDYINCHETLYLLPDPLAGLKAMKAVLKPEGIIRTNVHNRYQRWEYLRIQELFKFLGVMDDCSLKTSIELTRSFIECLKPNTALRSSWEASDKSDEYITANLILQGDKAFTVPETFALLEQADLEFISTTNWQFWNLFQLFDDYKQLPEEFSLLLESATEPQMLHLFELIHPANRLFDFWCSHKDTPTTYFYPSLLSLEEWETKTVQVNPVIQDLRFSPQINLREALQEAIVKSTPLPLNKYFSATSPELISMHVDPCILLYHLWEKPLPFPELVAMWSKLRPLDPLTLQPRTPQQTATSLLQILVMLEDRSLILVT